MLSDSEPPYHWRPSTIGGGGYVTGMIQDPAAPDVLYARCDVAGVFVSRNAGRSWEARNDGMQAAHEHCVRSLAIHPQQSRILFRASGDVRDGRCFGSIHRSTDGGVRWHAVCQDVDFYGNGPTRMYGEVLAIDPAEPNMVLAGGYSAGLWVSDDGGAHWAYRGLAGERITCVAVHPHFPGHFYVGTVSELDPATEWLDHVADLRRPTPSRLYHSPDTGHTWHVLREGDDIAALAFDPADPQVLYAAALRSGVLRSGDGGRTWAAQRPGGSRFPVTSVSASLVELGTVFAAVDTRGADPNDPPIGVYRSQDNGQYWQLIRRHTDADLRAYPTYMSVRFAGWATATVMPDAQTPGRLYMSNWYGVARSDDGGQTWDAQQFAGLETTCIEQVTVNPLRSGTVYIALADHPPCVSEDNGSTYHALAGVPGYPSSTAIVASQHHPGLLVSGLRAHRSDRDHGCCLVLSRDGGASIAAVTHFSYGLFVQALAEDPFTPSRWYALLDGPLVAGAGLYRSTDWGETWEQLPLALPPAVRTLPHQGDWVDGELLPVVTYQRKNVCGTNQLLCLDPHRRDVIYVGERTEGIFAGRDGGGSWAMISAGLPFGRGRASVLCALRADPQQPGALYAGFVREGLWYSADAGQSWRKLFPADDTPFNAGAVAISGAVIAVACEPLAWSPCASAVLISRDRGATWADRSDLRLGAPRWKGIAIEPATGALHLGSCGNGCFVVHQTPEKFTTSSE